MLLLSWISKEGSCRLDVTETKRGREVKQRKNRGKGGG